MDLFSPDLALTFLPGDFLVPDADFDMFLTCKSSIHTIAWFWLIVVLYRKSRRALPIREWIRWTRAFAFFQLLLNFVFRLMPAVSYVEHLHVA